MPTGNSYHYKGVYPMRKSLLGLVLTAAMLPVTTVYAAPNNNGAVNSQASGQTNSTAKAGTGKAAAEFKRSNKNAKAAIAAGVAAGLTVQEAMAELLADSPADAAAIVNAAVAAAPTQAAAITAFAISKGVPATVAVQAAIAGAPTQSAAIRAGAIQAAPTQIAEINNAADAALALVNKTATNQPAGSVLTDLKTTHAGTIATPGSTGGGGGGGGGSGSTKS